MHDLVSPPPAKTERRIAPCDTFPRRHLGPDGTEIADMLQALGEKSLEGLIGATVPESIRMHAALDLPAGLPESSALLELRGIAKRNQIFRSYLGQGYHGCVVPGVIQRNILENPGWYTAYTPYQAEIAQGRMEALVNFQQMVTDLTGMDIANASLLDEATAAAEAMHMAHAVSKDAEAQAIFLSENLHPQTLAVVKTRASALGIETIVGDEAAFDFTGKKVFAVIVQYPDTTGRIHDYTEFFQKAHTAGALAIVAADILSLTLLRSPGELGADIAIGSTQRFGVPLGFGGPHAAYMATRDAFKRVMPGRLVGVSKDTQGKPAYRLALQTREQHIRRDKATSNICTAQVLLAVMASMYAVYHGPEGLREIAARVHRLARLFAAAIERTPGQRKLLSDRFFDTVCVCFKSGAERDATLAKAHAEGVNLRPHGEEALLISMDETVTEADLIQLLRIFGTLQPEETLGNLADDPALAVDLFPASLVRLSSYLTHPVFNTHHTETEMLRYIRRLEAKDLSLTTSMIPLGSCTMKLNATSEMFPVSWPEFNQIHPFAPQDQTAGYAQLADELESWLATITGFSAVCLEPNAGSQGEYTGLLVIRKYHESRRDFNRNICLIPVSAHGTNPASAVMAGMKVIPVLCRADGDIDVADLKAKVELHQDRLSAFMVTYPSTHGVFEESIREICEVVHAGGGQVYMDGANMNAQVGLCRPGDMGADVCHLNLHKTFCIPHGGGGPGIGPIGVASHLASFLPDRLRADESSRRVGSIAAAPFGSASILPISWMYIRMMGAEGLKRATEIAILNANYVARRLDAYYPVLFKGVNGTVAHECIIDLRQFKIVAAEDVAKRLMDYGFHAPTLSFPVVGTLMIEPTESESKAELDRFCEAMISIHAEITEIESGSADKEDNLLKNAPHPSTVVCGNEWSHPYSRERAAFPAAWLREHKFWPSVARVDNVWGDRNLFCSCVPMG